MNRPLGGDLWHYSYLWDRQYGNGETEGRKARPVSLVAAVKDSKNKTNLFILPITSSPPAADRLAIEIPQIERRRAGLDDLPLWVIFDEYNHDVLETSFYFEPGSRIGRFSKTFHKAVLSAFVRATKEQVAKRIPRTD